ncbi:Zinc-iron permease, partial [Globisporangium splendens]
MVQTGSDVGVAFALNFAAGFATILGGMVVFSKRLVHLANPVSLAIALSISSGVMIFISLVEIFGESVHLLTEGIRTEDMTEETATGHGWLAATACFGCGILLIYGIDCIIHKLAPETSITEIENLENLRDSHLQHEQNGMKEREAKSPSYLESQTPGAIATIKLDEAARAKLNRMGLLSALAIGIHNMPEGIATYVGALQNTSVGVSLAIGIGLHNIPEGIAVAAPIYFATGSRWKGIMWCAISAFAEPVGGTIAWLAVGDGMDPVSEGVLFGIVCGIMVCICIKELLPTAFKFAKGQTHLVALGSFIGMFIMVTSLILFAYAGV